MKSRVHVSLDVTSLEEAVGFYEKLFGTEASKRRSDYANFRLDAPALLLALVESSTPSSMAKNQHFGVELFSDEELLSWRARVQEAGLDLLDEKNVTCCYAVADKFWATDPDGHRWEFWVRRSDAETMHAPAEAATPKACCAP